MKWTKLSCRTFKDNQARLQLFALAYNLGNFLRRLALPKTVCSWKTSQLVPFPGSQRGLFGMQDEKMSKSPHALDTRRMGALLYWRGLLVWIGSRLNPNGKRRLTAVSSQRLRTSAMQQVPLTFP